MVLLITSVSAGLGPEIVNVALLTKYKGPMRISETVMKINYLGPSSAPFAWNSPSLQEQSIASKSGRTVPVDCKHHRAGTLCSGICLRSARHVRDAVGNLIDIFSKALLN